MKRKSIELIEPVDEQEQSLIPSLPKQVKKRKKPRKTNERDILQLNNPTTLNTSDGSNKKFHILSIDIGIKNLGYSVISYDNLGKKELTDLTFMFDIFDISTHIPKKKDIVSSRCEALIIFLHELYRRFHSFETIIIERQVNQNTMAMELMYAITMAVKLMNTNDANIIIFDPKDKFLKLGLEYTTKNKSHKKQSIFYAKNVLMLTHPELVDWFNGYDKKDDVSDAMNQALVWMLINGFLRPTIDEYKQIILSMNE